MNKRLKRCMRKMLAAAMVLTLVGGMAPVQPVAELIRNASGITAHATEGTEIQIGYDLDEDGVLTLHAGTYVNPTIIDDSLNAGEVNKIVTDGTIILKGDCTELFSGFYNVTEVILTNVDTTEVTSMKGMFQYLHDMTIIDISSFRTPNVTDMSGMFDYCERLQAVDITNFDPSNVTTVAHMFDQCQALTSIDLSNFHTTSKLTDMQYMFYDAYGLSSIDLSAMDTSSVTNMNSLFRYTNITSVDFTTFSTASVTDMSYMLAGVDMETISLAGLDTSNVTNMSHMFEGCTVLKSIDMTGLDTAKVEDMSYLFADCKSIETIELGGINTSSVTDMASMFYNCCALESIDVDIDTSNVTNMNSMFQFYSYAWPVEYTPTSSLKHINFGPEFTTANVTSMNEMFYGCTQLEELDLSRFDRTNVTDISGFFGSYDSKLSKITLSDKMYIDSACNLINITTQFLGPAGWYNSTDPNQEIISGGTDGIILPAAAEGSTVTYQMAYNNPEIGYNFDSSTGTLTITKGEMGSTQFKTLCGKATDNLLNIKKVVAGSDVKFTESLYGMFQNLDAVEEVDFSAADMTGVTSMEHMFSYCYKLRSVKTGQCSSTLTSLKQMFMNCSALETIDISGLVTSEVTSMSGMFNSCSVLESVNLSGFDTSKVTDMSSMFAYCNKLNNLDLSGFHTSLVTDMRGMFSGCHNVRTITFSSAFTTASVTNFSQMFCDCKSLQNLDLSGFTFGSSANTQSLFSGADLRELTIPSSLTVNTNMYLHNTGYSNDRTVTFGGWYNTNNENVIVSGENTNAAFSGAGTYRLKTTDTGIRYSLEGDVLTITAGTIGYQSYKGDDVSSIVSYLNNENNTTIKTVVVGPDVRFYDNGYQFEDCDGVETIDLSNAVLQKAPDAQVAGQQDLRLTKLNSMFSSCPDLKTIVFPDSLDTSAVTQMYSMFSGCSSLESVDLSKFNTASLTSVSSMFSGCSSLRTLDLSKFDFSKLTFVDSMFNECNLTELTLPASLTSINSNYKLTNLYCSDDLSQNYVGWAKKNTMDIVTGGGKYAEFSSAAGAGTYVWVQSELDYTYSNNTLTLKAGYYNSDIMQKLRYFLAITPSKIVVDGKEEGAVVLFGNCSDFFKVSDYGTVNVEIVGGLDSSKVTTMYSMFSRTKGSTLNMGLFDTAGIKDMSSLFNSAEYSSIVFGGKFDSSSVLTMNYMFYGAKVNSVDFTGLDTSSTTDFNGMFSNCSTVDRLDLSAIDFSSAGTNGLSGLFRGSSLKTFNANTLKPGTLASAQSLKSMFYGCEKLQTVDFTGVSIAAVTTMEEAFKNCTALKAVTFGTSVPSEAVNMKYAFDGCSVLENIVIADGAKLKPSTFEYAFQNCKALETVPFSGMDTSSLYGMYYGFAGCTALKSLDLSGNNINNCKSFTNTFDGCTDLESVTFPADVNITASNVSCAYMFRNCASLKNADIGFIDFTGCYDIREMFKGCTALETVVFGKSAYTRTTNCSSVFDGDDALVSLTIPAGMSITSTYSVPNKNFYYDGWCDASDAQHSIVSGTYTTAVFKNDTENAKTYMRVPKVFDVSTVKSASLTLEGQIGLNFYAGFPESVMNNPDAYVELSGPNGKEKLMIADAEVDAAKGYKFTYKLAAKQLHDTVTLSVYDGTSTEPLTLHNAAGEELDGNVYSYAVINYINVVKNNSSYSGSLRNLVKSLEIYGTYAQKYFDYDTDTANESSLDTTVLNYVKGLTYSNVSGYRYTKPNYPDGLQLTGYSLVLESTTTFKLYFECDDINKLKFELDSLGEITPTHISGKRYVIEIKDIVAKSISQYHNVYIYDADTDDMYCRLNVSPLAYVYSALKQLGTSEEQSDINLCNLMRSFRYYNTYASSYFS